MTWVSGIVLLAHEGHAAESADGATTLIDQIGGIVPLAILAGGVLAVLLVAFVIFRSLRSGKKQHAATQQPLAIDVASLPSSPPGESSAQLEVYNVPMRLALLVIAPVGREGKVPPSDQLPQVVDAIAPNLMQVLTDHQPEFRRWPPQLSSQGFSQIFFNNVPLPGDGGKNTPYCALAGRFDTPSGPFLAGLVCIAKTPNAIGQIAIAQPGQWLDVMRVKA